MTTFSATQIIAEVASLADSLQDHPLFFSNRQAAEGITAMLQAADTFSKASTNADKLDAALWQNEAYLLFSGALPDTGSNEKDTAWATANQIAKLFGGPALWEQKCQEEFQ